MKTAVIYARVSSVGERQSTQRQVSDLIEYATRNNLQLLQIYEEHVSGVKKNDERPILSECLSFCMSNHIDCILVSELSRLGRNVYTVLENVHYCIENNINIYFQKEGLSLFQNDGTPNPFLTIFVSVLGTCAQIERENIQFRLKSGRQQYIASGGKVGRKPGSVKTIEKKEQEYKSVLRELRRGTSVRRTAKLCDVSISTVQRIKKEFHL